MTPKHHNGDDSNTDESDATPDETEHADAQGRGPDWTPRDPVWLAQADPSAAAEYYRFALDRAELMTEIGAEVGFQHDPDRDRLRKDELAKILVFAKAHNAQL